MYDQYPVEIDGTTGEVETLPPEKGRYRCKLETLQDCRREMAKVYRESRSQIIDVSDGSKFVFMLGAMGKLIESSDMEQRLEVLETQSRSKGGK
jgi:hypothetical protein